MNAKKILLGGGSALLAGTLAAAAAGLYTPGLPIVGNPGYCASQVNGVCSSTIPAGPTGLTGSELIPADTGLASGQSPQTVAIPASLLSGSTNKLIGGNMNTNLAQRLSTTKGLASVAGLSPAAAVMTVDGWYTIAAAAGVTVTVASGASEAIPALGTTKAVRLARTSSGAAGQMCLGQTLDQATSASLIGNNAVFSFYELNGAAQSALGANFTAEIAYSSGAAAAGTQATLGYAGSEGSKFALGLTTGSGGPTNMTVATPVFSSGTSGAIATTGVATLAGSTTWTRYALSAPIPAVIPGTTTAVTDVSVLVCFSPTLTTAITTDWIELQGLQLEGKPSGVVSPSGFDQRAAAFEAMIDYSYWYYNFESQTAITAIGMCENTASTVANCFVSWPVPMRIVPAVAYTNGFAAFAQVGETSIGACTTLSAAATLATLPTVLGAYVNCTASVGAAGTANTLMSLGTSSAVGIISASALP